MPRQDPIQRKLKLLDDRLDETSSLHNRIFSTSPLLLPVLGFIAGIILQAAFDLAISTWITALCILTVIAAASSYVKKQSPSIILLAYIASVAFACVGAIRYAAIDQPYANDIRNVVGQDRVLATIRGRIFTPPKKKKTDGWLFGTYLSMWSKPSTSFYIKLDEIKNESGFSKTAGSVRVQIDGTIKNLGIGDSIEIDCWLSRFNEPLNPGQFDIKKYLQSRGVFVAAQVNSPQAVKLLAKAPPTSFGRLRNRFTAIASESLYGQTLPKDKSSPLLAALILGERADIGEETYNAFRKTGLAHFISLSGMHIGILAGFIWFLLKTIGLTKRPRAAMCFLLIVIYILIVPPRAATLRAAVLCWFFCLSVIFSRKTNALNTLSLAGLVLLYIRPGDIFIAGFQLSYMTVLGIILLQRHISNWMHTITTDRLAILHRPKTQDTTPISFLRWFTTWAIELLATGFSAWIGGAGVMLYHFGTITPLASMWTVLIFPLVLFILAAGFAKMIMAVLLPTLAMAIGALASNLADALAAAVKLIAKIDVSQITIGATPMILIVCYYIILIFIRFAHLRTKKLKTTVSVIMAASIILSLGIIKYNRTFPDDLKLTCLAVDHGQAALLTMPGGKNILIDAGSQISKDCGGRIIVPYLMEKGIAKLDAIILTHGDLDHITGVAEVIAGTDTKTILANSAVLEKAKQRSSVQFLNDYLTKKNAAIQLLGPETINSETASLTNLWPPPETCDDPNIMDNDKSQVFLAEYAGKKILLCGDIELHAQEKLFEMYPDLKADVVLMPHHGSTTNLMDGFVEKLAPETIIVSCGQRRQHNAYKPKNAVNGFYTPVNGAITVTISPDGDITTTGFVSAK